MSATRDYDTNAYYTIQIRKDSELHNRIKEDARIRNTKQIPTLIRTILEKYYQMSDLREVLQSMSITSLDPLQANNDKAEDRSTSNVDEALEVWNE